MTQTAQQWDKRLTHGIQLIFDVRRNNSVNVALNETVSLHAAQSLSQHFWRYPLDATLQIAVPQRARSQQVQDGDPPFAAQQLNGILRLQRECPQRLNFAHIRFLFQ
ncbi:MAG TPA: hypothetical protein VNO32_63575 [Candidatus Acidoferrum sp.]|nr:hypothetical protein [Candidatus Acidoferrum sp.]